jgi:hypothetical protein
MSWLSKAIKRNVGAVAGGAAAGPVGALLGSKADSNRNAPSSARDQAMSDEAQAAGNTADQQALGGLSGLGSLLGAMRNQRATPGATQGFDVGGFLKNLQDRTYFQNALGSLGALGQLAGSNPQWGQLMQRLGIPYGPTIENTYSPGFVSQLTGQGFDQLATQQTQNRDQALAQLSAAGLGTSGARVGFERDFAAQNAENQANFQRQIMIEKRISDRQQQMEAIANVFAAAGHGAEAQVLINQAQGLNEQLRTSQLARQLAPYQLGVSAIGTILNGYGAASGAGKAA